MQYNIITNGLWGEQEVNPLEEGCIAYGTGGPLTEETIRAVLEEVFYDTNPRTTSTFFVGQGAQEEFNSAMQAYSREESNLRDSLNTEEEMINYLDTL